MSMKGRRARRREAAAAAVAVQGCAECGGLFEGAAFRIHRDYGQCLPAGAFGQLIEIRAGGRRVWAERWKYEG